MFLPATKNATTSQMFKYPAIRRVCRASCTCLHRTLNMPLDIIPNMVDPETVFRMEQSGQPLVVYDCELQGAPCGMFVEGTTSAVSAHLRRHGITGPDSATTTCTWDGCYTTLKKGSMARHILTHLGVKARCSVCGIVRCRSDVLLEHVESSGLCHLGIAENVSGPKGHIIYPTSWAAGNEHQV
ncbi:uncharacterized protein EDB93DRAFT_197940 [Suillus bovinus]|uniref:uncharacterized protein n=1 Tax=Suillus bovinus TaxID=48563 RepID=UPI001B864F97|nr:uncharacterized protein EDB93DRAFT_197940 [Suillus bovinus]KAG2127721.1 hypothetical protein EDB93DRAFT_197940 [Suillus bovinus]